MNKIESNQKSLMKIKKIVILTLIYLMPKDVFSIFPDNIFRLGCSTDQTIAFPESKDYLLQFSAEGTFNTYGHDLFGKRVNPLQIWQPNQNSLGMLRGFASNTATGQLCSLLNSANDDGIRGHINTTAHLEAMRFNFIAKKKLPFDLFANLLIPVFHMKLSRVELVDLTKEISFTDQLTKTYLTNHIAQNIYTLGDGLDVANGWEKNGLGDIELTLSWQKIFRQAKPVLKRVMLGLYGGLTIPSGVRQNENLLMPIPFGNDGATGVIFGGNIELQWWQYLRGGIDTHFMNLFSSSRERRIKTASSQTDLFLLAKTETLQDWGFTQQYALYLETCNLYTGASLRGTYRYIKHNDDKLNIFNQSYASAIANTAMSLEEWTQHIASVALIYESERAVAKLFYDYPFNGKNTIQSQIFGGYIGLYF